MTDYPTFDELPLIEKVGLRHSWDVFGERDDLGTLNFVGPESRVRAAQLVSEGQVVNLDLPLHEPSPPLYSRAPFTHEIFQSGRNSRDDRLEGFFLQGSTQWDGLRHIRAREFGFYGGHVEEFESPEGPLGIEHWVAHGMVGRGVLLDVAAHLESQGASLDPFQEFSISADLLEEVREAQGVSLETGDFLLVRVGWVGRYLQLGETERAELPRPLAFPGLSAGEDIPRFLWDNRVAAVAADNPACEVSPGDPSVGSFHRRTIPMLGLAVGELFVLDELASRCSGLSRWEFMFAASPLNLQGGVGSPANAMAIL